MESDVAMLVAPDAGEEPHEFPAQWPNFRNPAPVTNRERERDVGWHPAMIVGCREPARLAEPRSNRHSGMRSARVRKEAAGGLHRSGPEVDITLFRSINGLLTNYQHRPRR